MREFRKRCEGAAMVESCLVMVLLCLILYGILQVSILTAAHDVMVYATSCGLRCATIGYNDEMVKKTVRVAALPNMGPKVLNYAEEQLRIQEYLALAEHAEENVTMGYISDLYWQSLDVEDPQLGDYVELKVNQRYPMVFPFVGAIYNEDHTELSSEPLEMRIENHAALYLAN